MCQLLQSNIQSAFFARLGASVSLLFLRLVGSYRLINYGVGRPVLVEEDTTEAAHVEVLSLVEGGGQKAGRVR